MLAPKFISRITSVILVPTYLGICHCGRVLRSINGDVPMMRMIDHDDVGPWGESLLYRTVGM